LREGGEGLSVDIDSFLIRPNGQLRYGEMAREAYQQVFDLSHERTLILGLDLQSPILRLDVRNIVCDFLHEKGKRGSANLVGRVLRIQTLR